MPTQPIHKNSRAAWWFWGGLALIIGIAVSLQAKVLADFPLSPDEGIHLMWLRLLSAGYAPYSEVYITYPPLYPLTIQTVWQFWPTEAGQRWLSIIFTAFGTVGIALLARQFAGRVAGLAAALLALTSPPLLEHSRAVLGEFHSIVWTVWAIWLAWLYLEAQTSRQRRLFLILSGLCFSASLLTKLLSPFIGPLLLLILLVRWISDQQISFPLKWAELRAKAPPLLQDVTWWGAALLLPTLILFFVFDMASLLQQVVEQRFQAWGAYTEAEAFWPPRLERGLTFAQEHPALIILALLGLGLVWTYRQKHLWLLVAWLLLALTMLGIHNPIRSKHFLILIPPLAVLGGGAVACWLKVIQQWRVQSRPPSAFGGYRKLVVFGGGVLLGLLSMWQIVNTVEVWQTKASEPQPPTDEVEALAFIEAITAPGDCLITDDTQLVYWSGRMVPPELAEVSSNRLQSGALTLEQLISLSDQYDCQVVAAVSNRIPKYLPDYMAWVKGKYLGLFHYGDDDIFFAKMDTDPNPDQPLWANFDNQLIFHGYSLPQAQVSPGDRIPLTLIWEAQAIPDKDYAIFIQGRDEQHVTWLRGDHQPYQGLLPTSRWPQGAVIQEMVWLDIPADTPPGVYPLYIGLYGVDNQERLPLFNDTSGENALIIGPVVVE